MEAYYWDDGQAALCEISGAPSSIVMSTYAHLGTLSAKVPRT